MPTGPNGEKRPQDPASAAVVVGKIATGQIEEDVPRRRFLVRVENAAPKRPKRKRRGLT